MSSHHEHARTPDPAAEIVSPTGATLAPSERAHALRPEDDLRDYREYAVLDPGLGTTRRLAVHVHRISDSIAVGVDAGAVEATTWLAPDEAERLAIMLLRAARHATGETACSVEAHATGAGRCCLHEWMAGEL